MGILAVLTDRLLKLIQRPGWDLFFGTDQLFLHCPSKLAADSILDALHK